MLMQNSLNRMKKMNNKLKSRLGRVKRDIEHDNAQLFC